MRTPSVARAASVLCSALLMPATACNDDPLGFRWVLGSADGRVVILDMTPSSELEGLLLSVSGTPPVKRILVVDVPAGAVDSLLPLFDYREPASGTISDGRRIVSRDWRDNSIVVHDTFTGEVRRFAMGRADILPAAVDSRFVLFRVFFNTSGILLDTLSGEERVVEFGLSPQKPYLFGDLILFDGAVPNLVSTFEFVGLNWRTGERRPIASNEIVEIAAVVDGEVLWATRGRSDPAHDRVVVRATNFATFETRQLASYEIRSDQYVIVDALGPDAVMLLRWDAAEDPDSSERGAYSLVYQPFSGEPRVLRTSRHPGLGAHSVFVEDKIAFLVEESNNLVVFDPATGLLDDIALPQE